MYVASRILGTNAQEMAQKTVHYIVILCSYPNQSLSLCGSGGDSKILRLFRPQAMACYTFVIKQSVPAVWTEAQLTDLILVEISSDVLPAWTYHIIIYPSRCRYHLNEAILFHTSLQLGSRRS